MIHDNPNAEEGFEVVLASEPDLQVIGDTVDILEGLSLVKNLQPDIVVLDLNQAGTKQLDVISNIRSRAPQTRIIVLSPHTNIAIAAEALGAGAMSYISSKSAKRNLTEAIQAVRRGQQYLGPPLSEEMLTIYLRSLFSSSGK